MESNETERAYEARSQDGTASEDTAASGKTFSHPVDLTRFQLDALLVIAQLERDPEESYGLAIKRRLETYLGEDINHGRLYPNLDQLVGAGLLEKSELDKRTNKYELTPAGVHLLRERAQWVVGALDLELATDIDLDEERAAGGSAAPPEVSD